MRKHGIVRGCLLAWLVLAGGGEPPPHILGDLQQLLRDRFGIEHTTLQLESDRSPLLQISGVPGKPDRAAPRDRDKGEA